MWGVYLRSDGQGWGMRWECCPRDNTPGEENGRVRRGDLGKGVRMPSKRVVRNVSKRMKVVGWAVRYI